ncbi:MAE_28990/MAE_18760 family HEPN-like nuclease, partial [Psychrobacter sp. Pi2-52]|uniref:MAE_28990/MAE_18760 family HEPN-like nuclease n=1 Tax=Psychrobacter sp. Pi2-52 TaxID=2774133 RepID=UPI001F11C217
MQIDNINLQFAYENFQERLQEVQKYVDFVKYLADISHPSVINETLIPWSESPRDIPPQNHEFEVFISPNSRYEINRDLQKTLRASTYLLLYNLMESTMSESINAIHETIKEEEHSILELS